MSYSERRKRSKWDEVPDDRQGERPTTKYSEIDRAKSRWDEDTSGDIASARSSSHPRHSRSRSPSRPSSNSGSVNRIDPAVAAAAAAARINAQIQAKRGSSTIESMSTVQTSDTKHQTTATPSSDGLQVDMYVADGDYIRDIEVNDLRNRYTLTKGATQKMIKDETGADVTTRGAYYPDKTMATAANPPLYLHITSTTKEGLEKAVAKIEDLMQQELGPLVDERRFRRREPDPVERDEFGRRKWPEERVVIGLEPIPGFNLRAAVVGQGGQYVKHIQQETRCRVQIKGRGSGFTEHSLGRESDEPLYLHVTGPDPKEVENAKGLCVDLLESVKAQYESHKAQSHLTRFSGYGGSPQNAYGVTSAISPPPPPPPPPPPGAPGTSFASSQMSPTPPPPTAAATGQDVAALSADYSNSWQNYQGSYGSTDPYAAYGGYQNYVQYYNYYYQQQQQQHQTEPSNGETSPEA